MGRLLRRPRHTLGFDVHARVCDRLLLGAGGYLVDDRRDFGVVSGSVINGDDYFTARFYGAYDLCENVVLNFRIENGIHSSSNPLACDQRFEFELALSRFKDLKGQTFYLCRQRVWLNRCTLCIGVILGKRRGRRK